MDQAGEDGGLNQAAVLVGRSNWIPRTLLFEQPESTQEHEKYHCLVRRRPCIWLLKTCILWDGPSIIPLGTSQGRPVGCLVIWGYLWIFLNSVQP